MTCRIENFIEKVRIDFDSPLYKACGYFNSFSIQTKKGYKIRTSDEELAIKLAKTNKTKHTEEPDLLSFTQQKIKIQQMVSNILVATGCKDYVCYIGGDQNNTYKSLIYPLYKGNRNTAKPVGLGPLKKHVIEMYDTVICNGIEADDVLVDDYLKDTEMTIIAAMDKDILRFVPGKHYDYYHDTFVTTSYTQCLINFACAVLSGDASDNIPGLCGFPEVKYEADGSITPKGRTYDEFLKGHDNYAPNTLAEALQDAYQVYKKELHRLSKADIQRRFMLACHLLWIGKDKVDRHVDFYSIFNKG